MTSAMVSPLGSSGLVDAAALLLGQVDLSASRRRHRRGTPWRPTSPWAR
jgi:hypothetical protein